MSTPLKDFSKRDLERWVEQESEKHPTVTSMLDRIASERRSIEMFEASGVAEKYPMSHKAHAILIEVLHARAAEAIGTEFVDVLKDWIAEPFRWDGNYSDCKTAEEAWAKMCADNKRHHAEGSTCCASHDWCDANMAMAEAFENLGLDPLPDDEAERERMTTLWNEAWTAAGPALRGEAG